MTSTQADAIKPYVNCFKPIVAKNDAVSGSAHLNFDDLFAKVKRECVAQRIVARDTLAAHVATQIQTLEGRQLPIDDAWKESLIDEATIKWMGRGFGSSEAH